MVGDLENAPVLTRSLNLLQHKLTALSVCALQIYHWNSFAGFNHGGAWASAIASSSWGAAGRAGIIMIIYWGGTAIPVTGSGSFAPKRAFGPQCTQLEGVVHLCCS